MNRTSLLTVALIGLGMTFAAAENAQAGCPRGGGGRINIYPQAKVHHRPAYHHPVHVARPVHVPQQQHYPQQHIVQHPVSQPRPVVQTAPPVNAAPPTQVAPQPQTVPAPQQVSGVQPASSGDARNMALEALGGWAGELQAPAAQDSVPSRVGTWSAKLANGATVQLTLTAEGTFNWVANNKGQLSTFAGNYTLENDSLTLIRANDGEKLIGTLIPSNDGGFTFKLNGVQDSGIQFASL